MHLLKTHYYKSILACEKSTEYNRIELENRPGVSKRLHAVDALQVVAEAAGGVGLVRLVGADQANVDALVRPPDTRMSLK